MTTDKNLIKERFEASFITYNELADVQRCICARLAQQVDKYCVGDVRRAFEIGAGTGFLTGCFVRRWPDAKWYLNDLISAVENFISPQVGGIDVEYLWGDAEKIEYPANLDLVASTSTAQWFEDKQAFANKIAASLNTGGYLALSLFGPDNFKEIKATTGEGLDYYSLQEFSAILKSAGFKTLMAEEYTETLTFESPRDALKYIKSLGVNSVKKTSWNTGKMEVFETEYRKLFSSGDGGITLTYHPMLFIAERI